MARGARAPVKGRSGPEAGKGRGQSEVRGPEPAESPAPEQELPPEPAAGGGKRDADIAERG